MSIYSSIAPAGIFAPSPCCPTGGLTATLSFARAAALLYGRAPTFSPGGEVLQSYIAVGLVTGELEPNKGGIQRTVGGQVIDLAYNFIVFGTPPLRELDRAYISGGQLEVVAVNQFGTDHAEVQLKWIGR